MAIGERHLLIWALSQLLLLCHSPLGLQRRQLNPHLPNTLVQVIPAHSISSDNTRLGIVLVQNI